MIVRQHEKLGISGAVILVGMAVIAVVIATHADPQTLSLASLREGHGGYLLALAVASVATAAGLRTMKKKPERQ
jgi:hypothetical protein